MRQLNLLALIIVTMFVSCVQEYEIPTIEKERDYLPKPTRVEVDNTEDGLMVLGPQLANPYLLTTMQQARAAILQEYPLASIPELETSHYYVRFAPQNDDELYSLLQDTTVVFYEYPLDREVISGTYYHDPAIADSLPTYQYASISKAVWDANYANSNIAHTILANLFIPEEAQDQLEGGDDDGGFDWEIGGGTITPIDPEPFEPRDSTGFIPFPGPGTGPIGPNGLPDGVAETNGMADLFNPSAIAEMLVDKSLVISGHETEGSATLAKNDWIPSGRITVDSGDVGAGIPLVGAKIRVRRWFTTHTAITDNNGEFICDKGFNRPANYSIIWERAYWDIRSGNVGQAYYNGPKQNSAWNLHIGYYAGRSKYYATIHRAAYRTYYGDISAFKRPNMNKKVKIAYHHSSNGNISGIYYDNWWHNSGIAPTIKIYNSDNSVLRVLSSVFHELAGHAAHSYNCSSYPSLSLKYKEAWAIFVQSYLTHLEYKPLNFCNELLSNIYSNTFIEVNPDNFYNCQSWTKDYVDHPRRDYPPLLIDLVDNYNQQYRISDRDYSLPYDNIQIRDIEFIQSVYYASSSFQEIKSLISSNHNSSTIDLSFRIEDLDRLFDYYINY